MDFFIHILWRGLRQFQTDFERAGNCQQNYVNKGAACRL
jgi:hypothetical protein